MECWSVSTDNNQTWQDGFCLVTRMCQFSLFLCCCCCCYCPLIISLSLYLSLCDILSSVLSLLHSITFCLSHLASLSISVIVFQSHSDSPVSLSHPCYCLGYCFLLSLIIVITRTDAFRNMMPMYGYDLIIMGGWLKTNRRWCEQSITILFSSQKVSDVPSSG